MKGYVMTSSVFTIPANVRTVGTFDFRNWSRRTASLTSGISLSVMAVGMIVGYFGGVLPLITPGDAERTAASIAASGPQYLAGVLAIYVVIALDLVAAASWYALFKGVNSRLSAAAALMRTTFAGLFALATSQLVVAYTQVSEPGASLAAFERFRTIWLISLGLFGAFLILEGYLGLRSGFIAKVFPILLAIAGVGYIADAIGVAFIDGFNPTFGLFGFVGEVAMIFWLLIRGRRLSDR
jgi:hypothetical protein